jgi:hypothetical protein
LNEGANFFGPSTGLSVPAGVSPSGWNVNVFVLSGPGTTDVIIAVGGLAPVVEFDFALRNDFIMPSSEPAGAGPFLSGNSGPFLNRPSSEIQYDLNGPAYGDPFGVPSFPGAEARLETIASNSDPAFATSVESTQTNSTGALQIMAISTGGGRTASGPSVQSGSLLGMPADHAGGPSGSGWISYLVGADWTASGAQTFGFSGDASAVGGPGAGDPVSASALADGSAPVLVLLSGPDVPAQTTASNLEQVAELIPPSESSLALLATLWTVPSDRSPTAQPDQRLETSTHWSGESAAMASSTAYLIGLDQAFEQSHREIQKADPGARGLMPTERERLELDQQLNWERSIVPVATGWVSDRGDGSLGESGSLVDDDAINSIAGDQLQVSLGAESSPRARDGNEAEHRSESMSFLTAASLPLLSALSATTALTGWLWTRRHRKRRLAL